VEEVGGGVIEDSLGGVGGGEGGMLGLGGGVGFGFSGLIPPSQWGPEYISVESPFCFHFCSKSAAALFGVSPSPMV